MELALEELCGLPVTIFISTFYEVKKHILNFSINDFGPSFEYYREWELKLQSLVTEVMENFIPPLLAFLIPRHPFPQIGLEMLKWTSFIELEFGLERKFIVDFISGSIFNSKGLMDEVKAAKELVRVQSLSLLVRYEIACYYCKEDLILPLWQEICYSDFNIEEMVQSHSHQDSVVIWSQYLQDKHKSPTSVTEPSYVEGFLGKLLSYAIQNDNSEAMKFYFKSKIMLEDYKSEDHNTSLINYLKQVSKSYQDSGSFPQDLLLSRKFLAFRDILLFLFETEEQDNIEYIIGQTDISYTFLKSLLLWPFQDLFMKMINSVFNNKLTKMTFYFLLHNIVDLICDACFSETYDYRILLREFWTQSETDYKIYSLDVECGCEDFDLSLLKPMGKFSHEKLRYLVPKVLLLDKFTTQDADNFLFILESGDSEERRFGKIFYFTSVECCFRQLIILRRFELVDTYINFITSSEEEREFGMSEFESTFVLFALEKDDLEGLQQFINWSSNPGEIDIIKNEFFRRNNLSLRCLAKTFMTPSGTLTSIDKFLKWFLNSDDMVAEFKMNVDLDYKFEEDVFIDYDIRKLEDFWNWLGYSSEKIRLKNKEILRSAFYYIEERLFKNKMGKFFRDNILYLCSYNREIINEFIADFRAWCVRRNEENVRDLDNEYLLGFDFWIFRFCYKFDPRPDLLSIKSIDIFCSMFMKELHYLADKREKV